MNFRSKLLLFLVTLTLGIGLSSWLSPKSKTLPERIFAYHSSADSTLLIGKNITDICYKDPRDAKVTAYYQPYEGQFYTVISYDDDKFYPAVVDRHIERVCLRTRE